jgi:hypothetical protein
MDGLDMGARTADGRFAPGSSGNPAGRPKGARNRRSALAAVLREGEEDRMLRLIAEKALEGDVSCLKYCADRLQPRRRTVHLDLPEGAESNSAAFHAAVLRAAADGEITPEEAASLSRAVAARQPVMKAHLLERRLATADATEADAALPPEFLFPLTAEWVAEDAPPTPVHCCLASHLPATDPPPQGAREKEPAPVRPPVSRESKGGGLPENDMPGGDVPACSPLPDPPPQGGREKVPPVNPPVSQAPLVHYASIAGVNRIYAEQEKLPKRPNGTIRGFIAGWLPPGG